MTWCRPLCRTCRYEITCSDEDKEICRDLESIGLECSRYYEADIPRLSEAGDA